MFSRAVRVLSIRGIAVRLDPSLLIIALLIGWTFAARFAADHGRLTGITMAVAGTVLFFASILAHELAHGLEARHRGLEVHGITLFLFGGVTEMEAHGHRPRDEFAIAAVGPWTSLVCGAIFGLMATSAGLLGPRLAGPVGDLAGLLGWLNVLLAIFNLVPGAPLDGGRVLRALLWWVTRDRFRAIRITARIGQALGIGLALFGLWVFATTPAGVLGAIWYVIVGLFLHGAARAELRSAKLDQLYSEWTVAELFDGFQGRSDASLAVDPSTLPTVRDDADLHTLIDAFQDHDVVLVVRDDAPQVVIAEREAAAAIGRIRRTRARPPAVTGIREPAGHTAQRDAGTPL